MLLVANWLPAANTNYAFYFLTYLQSKHQAVMFCPNSVAVVSSQGLFRNLGTQHDIHFVSTSVVLLFGNNCSHSRQQLLYRRNSLLIVQQSLDGRRGVTGTSNKISRMICLTNTWRISSYFKYKFHFICKLHHRSVGKKDTKSHHYNSRSSNGGLQSTGWMDELWKVFTTQIVFTLCILFLLF